MTVLDPDPYTQYGSGSREAILTRIHIDPDPKHWFWVWILTTDPDKVRYLPVPVPNLLNAVPDLSCFVTNADPDSGLFSFYTVYFKAMFIGFFVIFIDTGNGSSFLHKAM